MRFWDTSALVPLLVQEDATDAVRAQHRSDPTLIVAWTTLVECGSAIARAEHEQLLTREEATAAFARLDALARTWREVEPSDELREIARRLLRAHRLRAADALQLAAATLASERRPASLTVLTLDDRLETAAVREGFTVLVPGRGEAESPETSAPESESP
ncbi:MAG: PIN domain-containing protein [Acidobacteria bacterium]|nr:PIN domain-containing protein [Acidobacteriota bacterium]